ncbi:MAG: malectin, partial [Bacteroidales bacterium]|nr:malectin [Bacteroidales bacterium]
MINLYVLKRLLFSRPLFAVIASLFLQGVALYAQNLINNPSFEHGTGNTPSSWYHPAPTATMKYSWEEDIVRTGSHSVSIEKMDEKNHAFWLQNLDPEANKYYNFSVSGKAGANTIRMDVIIRYWDNGHILGPPAVIKSRNVYESRWSELSFQFYLPPDIDSIQVLLELGGRTGKIYFDDVTLTLFEPPDNDMIAFNCGSSDFYFNSPDSILYFPDREYSPGNGGGYINSSDPPEWVFGFDIIGGTEERLPLYKHAAYGFDEYRFDVENGTYAVRLHFCENEYHWKDKRIQNISIEDITVLENFDI